MLRLAEPRVLSLSRMARSYQGGGPADFCAGSPSFACIVVRLVRTMLPSAPREGEGDACHLRQAPGLPATPAGGVVGAPGVKPFTPDPSGPSGRDSLATVTITTRRWVRGGAGRIGTGSGLDTGGRLRMIRASLSDASTATTAIGQPCRAPAARRARGAERERALAGCSGGASGPWRPGLKTYRKL
jgi:hypothetical protein